MTVTELAIPAGLAGFLASFGNHAGKKAANLMERLFGPLCDESGQLMGDQVRRCRVKSQVRTLARAYELCAECDIDPSRINVHFLAPLLEAAGDASDPCLEELWARLVAAASRREEAQHPAFISIVRDLRPADAVVILGCVDKGTHIALLPGTADVGELTASNLHRVGLVQYAVGPCDRRLPPPSDVALRHSGIDMVFTPLGRAFLAAVRAGSVVAERDVR